MDSGPGLLVNPADMNDALPLWVISVFFGLLPAIRAAKKDPIEALRYE